MVVVQKLKFLNNFIICDSSPLIALAKCNKLDILDRLFEEVSVPVQVYREFSVSGKPESAKMIIWAQGKIAEPGDAALLKANTLSLGPGETAAIALYSWRGFNTPRLCRDYKGIKPETNTL